MNKSKVEVVMSIVHEREVNKARYCPQNKQVRRRPLKLLRRRRAAAAAAAPPPAPARGATPSSRPPLPRPADCDQVAQRRRAAL